MSVAGLTPDLGATAWSNRGAWVTCSAVGEGIVSTYVEGRFPDAAGGDPSVFGPDAWGCWTGTSFAAPQVAGAVAQLCADGETSPRRALAALLDGGRDVAEFGRVLEILPGT